MPSLSPPQFDSADVFSEGLARVELHGKCGYVDISGRVVIPFKFVHAEPFTDGLALVYTTWGANIFGTEGWDFFRRAGYINHDGKFVIDPRNTLNARGFSEGIAPFQPGISTAQNPKWGYLDKSGKTPDRSWPKFLVFWVKIGIMHGATRKVFRSFQFPPQNAS